MRAQLTDAQVLPLQLIAERRARLLRELAASETALREAYAALAGVEGVVTFEQDDDGTVWLTTEEET